MLALTQLTVVQLADDQCKACLANEHVTLGMWQSAVKHSVTVACVHGQR